MNEFIVAPASCGASNIVLHIANKHLAKKPQAH